MCGCDNADNDDKEDIAKYDDRIKNWIDDSAIKDDHSVTYLPQGLHFPLNIFSCRLTNN